MPSATTAETTSVLPPRAARENVSAKLTALVEALATHPQMRPPHPHPTLYNIWDFAMRTDYILSELENVEAGRPLRYPEQIPDLDDCEGKPSPEKARELTTDVMTRSITIKMMMNERSVLAMMGLPAMDFGDDLKRKAEDILDALKGFERRS